MSTPDMSPFQRHVLLVSATSAAVPSGAFDRCFRVHRLPRDAAHEMQAKFQSKTVNVIRQRFEAFAVHRRREFICGGQSRPHPSISNFAPLR